jgi:anti-sigma factor RsiW
MPPSSDNHQKLERLIHRTLRELPARRAPSTLEQRVMAEIERRAALPWWHQSFAHWPLAARAAFLLVSAGLAAVVWNGTVWAFGGFEAAQFQHIFATQLGWIENMRVLSHAIVGFGEIIIRNIPALWLYGSLAIAAALYATFFGLGAAAYRSLYARR